MADASTPAGDAGSPSSFPLPRVTIKFCTQCKWMLRAAYFAQELLSTFSTALGEVALQPSTGGVFIVEITATAPTDSSTVQSPTPTTTVQKVLWDRKVDGGFPETKELKRRVRDVIQPDRDLGHVDRDHARPGDKGQKTEKTDEQPKDGERGPVFEGTETGIKKCEDCQ
ncbi:Rdx family-domain-containing protein [Rhypophila decipiens]|uniref:Rdx family-domain-containing protein n=1 Tax=Rhypophila decipiens TaxID=261697 RepID=A0AAN6YF27_9PEZI|nr:Rdx family-domain-containing protein [Rhypophila decipiens]